MIGVENVAKRFDPIPAVNNISFAESHSEVVRLLGPNGTELRTTMRILAGLFPPTAGRVGIGNKDLVKHSLQVKEHIDYFR